LKERSGKIFDRDFFTGIVISSLAFLAVATIPVLGPIVLIFIPLPIFFYYSKLGRIRGLVVFVVSLLVLVICFKILGSETNFFFFFLSGSLGLILSEVLRKSYSIEKTVLHSIVIFLILCSVLLIYYSVTSGQLPWNLIEHHISESIQENIRLYSQLDVPSEHIGLIKDNANQITTTLVSLFPALFLISASFTAWLNILAGRVIFQKSGMWYPDFGDLAQWKIPDRMIWLLIISGSLLFVPLGVLKVIALNLLMIFLFIYMFQGLAIIGFFFKKKNVPIFFRILCYFLIFAQQFLLLLVVGLGLFDVWVNFRKFNKNMRDHTV